MTNREAKLDILEKNLTVWIVVCITIDLLLGRFTHGVGAYLDSLRFTQISVLISICLFFMMHPTILGVAFGEVKKVFAPLRVSGVDKHKATVVIRQAGEVVYRLSPLYPK